MTKRVLRTPICEMLGIEYPLLLAGMGHAAAVMPEESETGVSSPELVAAVSNAGGMGVLGAAGTSPEALPGQIKMIRELTDKPFGVDFILPGQVKTGEGDYASRKAQIPDEYKKLVKELKTEFGLPDVEAPPPPPGKELLLSEEVVHRKIEIVFKERVAVLAIGLGSPAPFVERAREVGTKIIGVVGNVKTAKKVAAAGADIIVAQGTEGGGHTGRVGTMALIPQVVDAVSPVPVLAAGGIADGRGMAAALCLGAQGVWVGTAFLVSREANLPQLLKERILQASEEDARITRLYSGKTMRNVSNPLIEAWEARGISALPMGMQGLLMTDFLYAAKQAGRTELLMNAAGQASGMLRELKPAAQLVQEIVDGAVEALKERIPQTVAFA
jgi:NAD(P)H-dependent flavin oxidoreductase YrpB (nitropropane dioxygenase family)